MERLALSDFELGWLTAFYEGEGSVHFSQRVLPSDGKKYARGAYIRVQFTQKDLEPLYHVRTLVAGHGHSWMTTVGRKRDCSVLYYTNRAAILILDTILPWLSKRRQAQATAALNSYAARSLLPTRKVSIGLLGGALTTLGFYILTATGVVHPDPPAAVGAAAATVIGAILAYIVPEKDQAP